MPNYPVDVIERGPEFWDHFWLDEAKKWASASKDPSTKVGAVLVNYENVLVATGFNGFPRGVYDSKQRYDNRELKYKFIMHAEANAVVNAGRDAKGCSIYVYPAFGFPPLCTDCCKLIIQAGVREVVAYEVAPEHQAAAERWKESIEISRIMCQEAGVEIREILRS